MSSLALRRLGATLVAGGVAAAGLAVAGPAPRAAAAPDPVAPGSAVGWLAGQLDENDQFSVLDWQGNPTVDVSAAIDFGLGLAELEGSPDVLQRVVAGVDAALEGYLGDHAAPARIAKAAHFYERVGVDPSARGGDLRAQLEAAVDDTTGQLGGFPDAYGQVWAVRALRDLGSGEAAAATDFLVSLQCEGAGWGYDAGGCVSDVDATAWVVQTLLPQAAETDVDTAVDTALADGVAWLKGQQSDDGSFGAWGPNANSTGLAGAALQSAGATTEARAAALWVRSRQVSGTACDRRLGADGGAVGYDDVALSNGQTDGITQDTEQQWILATAQALPLLAAAPAASSPLAIAAPEFVRAGSSVTVRTAGIAPGANACVVLAGKTLALRGTTTTSGSMTLPTGTKVYSAVLRGPGGAIDATRVVGLAARTLPIAKRSTSVVRGRLQVVRVSGLVRGERVQVRYAGRVVARGTANTAGAFQASFNVGRAIGTKRVYAFGHFTDRKGVTSFRVR